MTSIEKTVEEIFSLYTLHGASEYLGEPVTQLEHMSQAAALAMEAGYDDEVILAAFFHDIGHLCVALNAETAMKEFGVIDHEEAGGAYLRSKGFSERLVRLVSAHVEAKRYLTFKRPGYYDLLSDASKETLKLQGGIMTEQEARAFESDPLCNLIIRLREWDDQAKQQGVPVIDLHVIKEKAAKLLRKSIEEDE